MSKEFKVGTLVEVSDKNDGNYVGMIVHIIKSFYGNMALVEQSNGIRTEPILSKIKVVEGDTFEPTYTQLNVGQEVKVIIGYSSGETERFTGTLTKIFPVSDGKTVVMQCVVEDEFEKGHRCALKYVYPIDFVSEIIN